MEDTLRLILFILFGVYIAVIILKYPYLGAILTVSSLPVIDLLPSIPYFDSVLPLLGAITVLGFLINLKGGSSSKLVFSPVHLFGLLFIIWMFITNPQAAWSGPSRNWTFTFIQLWALMLLASNLFDTSKKLMVLMWVFSIIAIVSAFYAITTGNIDMSEELTRRSRGFTDNANAAARYFTVAMIFLSYLRSVSKKPFQRTITLLGTIITYVGVFFTVSRTGIVLLFAAQVILFLYEAKGKQRIWLIFVGILGLLIVWILAASVFEIIETIIPAVAQGSDTMGLRYALWEAGWKMFLDKPLVGVGIGNFELVLPFYSQGVELLRNRSIWAHNTYIQILSETGIIGFLLFMGMFLSTIVNFIRARFEHAYENESKKEIWLIVFIVMLLGGITKSDHADKLTWMVMGLSALFYNQAQLDAKLGTETQLGLIKKGATKQNKFSK